MPTYISPKGNPEIWEEKPDGYFTPEEWEAREPEPPAIEKLLAEFTATIQAHLDAFAQTRGYDSIHTAATYVGDKNPAFAAEGRYAHEARSDTWSKCYEILGAVTAGLRALPSLEEVLAELPELEWPSPTTEGA